LSPIAFLSAAWSAGLDDAELADEQPLFDRGKHWFDGRGFEESGLLPLADPDLTQRRRGTKPNAGEARSWLVIAITTTSGRAIF
jgi:hypothetical protein